MLNSSILIQERIQKLIDLKTNIERKDQLNKKLEQKGSEYIEGSVTYFKYSVKVVALSGLCLFAIILALVYVFYSSMNNIILNWNDQTVSLTIFISVVVLFLLFYSSNQTKGLKTINKLNQSAAGWFDDVVSIGKEELRDLKSTYCELATNKDYILGFDESTLMEIETQINIYNKN